MFLASSLSKSLYSYLLDDSDIGSCMAIPYSTSLESRSERIFEGIDSGEDAKSLNLDLPRKRSRITSNVHLSPIISKEHEIGQADLGASSFAFFITAKISDVFI